MRLLELDLANRGLDKDVEVKEFIQRLAQVRVAKLKESYWFLDAVKESTQGNTPQQMDGAIFYAAECMEKYSGQVERIADDLPEHGKLILSTWTDNRDMTWMHRLDATFIQVHTTDTEYHKRMLSLPGHMSDDDYTRLS